MNGATLFEKFANQLSRWSKTGEEPKLGDWNIRAYLDLQEQRLKEKELKRTFDYSINGKVLKVGNFAIGQLMNYYNKRLNYSLGTEKITYEKNGRVIFKEKMDLPMYQLIKWPNEDRGNWKSDTYVCDNCANIETIETFEEKGCPYCGTHFNVSEMYPKVTNFYILENLPNRKLTFEKLLKIAVWAFIFAFVFSIGTKISGTEFNGIDSFGAILLVFFIVLFLAGLWLSPLIFTMAECMPVTFGMMGAKAKITSRLRKYDEAFSYDYFEGKALSLLRMTIFAKDATKTVQYRGEALPKSYADIVDMDYRGGLNVEKIAQKGEYIEVTLKVYMKNTYFVKGKCKKKNDTMFVRMRHNITWKVEPDFSIVKVCCHGCGGSFDATKHRNCPYCQKEYDAGRDDWEVLEITTK